MRVWNIAGSAVAVLGAAALVVGGAPAVFGQQKVVVRTGDGQDRKIVERVVSVGGGGHLGVSIRDVTADDVTKLKLPTQSGAVVEDVAAESPAAKAGIQKGDVVVFFDGEAVRSVQQLTRLVRETPPGRTVKVAVTRDGKRVDLSATPDQGGGDFNVFAGRPDIEARLQALKPRMEEFKAQQMYGFPGERVFAFSTGRGRLGVTVQDLNPELAEFFGVKDGVLVSSVAKDTPAARAGFKAGDVITAVDGQSVDSAAKLVDALREKDGNVTVAVVRDRKPMSLTATLEKAEQPKPKAVQPGIPT